MRNPVPGVVTMVGTEEPSTIWARNEASFRAAPPRASPLERCPAVFRGTDYIAFGVAQGRCREEQPAPTLAEARKSLVASQASSINSERENLP